MRRNNFYSKGCKIKNNVQTKMVQKLKKQLIDPPPKTPQILSVLHFALALHFLFFLGRTGVFIHTSQGMKVVDVSQYVLNKYSFKKKLIYF